MWYLARKADQYPFSVRVAKKDTKAGVQANVRGRFARCGGPKLKRVNRARDGCMVGAGVERTGCSIVGSGVGGEAWSDWRRLANQGTNAVLIHRQHGVDILRKLRTR